MATERITNPNCKHQWEKHQSGDAPYGIIATWDYCPLCQSERNRKVIKVKPKSVYHTLIEQGHHKEAKQLKDDLDKTKAWIEEMDIKKETGVWD